ncbi:uncharacterized protein LTHEOB_7019 [Lasiodiplodia theobromae]|uniref:uncharacterized protein n=1 Tax=Lasiodiplodia theobromae TaxID=45133 RepID=UPI0015C388DE|nr:uncharacterized protein LTHEOB_7019 [Lasiodiplodia theobromae]KAF4543285.1 hypothetical protein LTHEOB_7019 [Lasiodiplodia theobromae]
MLANITTLLLLLGVAASTVRAFHPKNHIFGVPAAANNDALRPRAGAASTAAPAPTPTPTSTVISFAFPGGQEAPPQVIPTAGVSGSIIDIQSSRTTLAFTCASAVQEPEAYWNGSSPGELCPWFTNSPVTIVYGTDYYGYTFNWTYGHDYYPARTTFEDYERVAAGTLGCAVTATPAQQQTPVASVDPTCTVDVTSIPAGLEPADVMPSLRCWWEDVAGPQKSLYYREWNSAAFNSCTSSLTATPTTEATGTYKASDVRYWTVTVTEVAAGVTVQPTQSASAAATVNVGLWGLFVVGLFAAFTMQ